MANPERSRELARERLHRFRARQQGQDIPKRKPGPPPSSHVRRLERQLTEVRAEIAAWMKRAHAATAQAHAERRRELPEPDLEELARLNGREASLLCALENLEGRPFRLLGPYVPMRPDLGYAVLWEPRASQIVYLGSDPPGNARKKWQFNARAPEWGTWEVGKPWEDGTIYVQAEPGRRAVPGEWVPAIHTAYTLNEYGGREFAARALFGHQEILAGRAELRPELASIFRMAAEEPRITGADEVIPSLLLRAAEVIETTGRVHREEDANA